MPTYYPSLVVDFRLTFDEALHVVTYPAPQSVPDCLRQVALPSDPHIEPLLLGGGPVSQVLGRTPLKASIQLPGYRTAGTFNFDLNFRDLPIDPRTVRSCACDIYLGTVAADRFAKGMRGPEADGSLASVLVTHVNGRPNPDTLLLTGIVDDWEVEHGEDGSTVSIKGRDMRGVLLDVPVSIVSESLEQVVSQLDLTKPINEVVEQILGFVPGFADFSVFVNPIEWRGGVVPAPASPEAIPRHRRGARGSRRQASPPAAGNSLKFWDLIVQYCYLVGGIPYFRGTQLCIRPSRTVFDQNRGPLDPIRNPTPFLGGRPRTVDAESGAPISPGLRSRKLVYGRDVSKLNFSRKLAGSRKPTVVRCVSHDTSHPERGGLATLEARWPPLAAEPARRTRVAPSGRSAQEDILTIPVAGVTSQAQLLDIARATFEEVGRGEMGGACEMNNLSSFGGDNEDTDMLRLRPGDGVEFAVDVRASRSSHPLLSPLTDNQRTSFDAQVAAVTERIGDQNLARVLVSTARGQIQEIQSFFRVQNVSYSWGDGGISVNFDFQNYVVSRNQIESADPAPGVAVERTAPRRTPAQIAARAAARAAARPGTGTPTP